MNDRFFIDTNILVYANDRSELDKHEKAKQIILEGIVNDNIAVSTQVISEFYITITKKIKAPLSAHIAKKEILLLKNIDVVDIDFHCVIHAINITNDYKLSYWDSLIIAAAQKARCNVLYSEDLNVGQKIETITIQNPLLGS